ncbi:MAG: T9SS type A sorting domain-containing protein [Candidatus Cloacimonetes bacterium]|nr:T9SS type A sorting domain-containing protein [Candidatus Cloacimonadota bacterium]
MNPILINNTFCFNFADECSGALCLRNPGDNVMLFNNVFWDNISMYDPEDHPEWVEHGGGNQIVVELNTASLLSHNLIFGNNDIEGCIEDNGIFTNINDFEGSDWITVYNIDDDEDTVDLNHGASYNINSDPNFSNQEIGTDSPCFEAGISLDDVSSYLDNTFQFPSIDIYGNPRFAGTTLDIGHCEAYDLGLYLEKFVLSLGNVNPDSPVSHKLLIQNQSYNRTIDNISCEISDGLDTYLEITFCPSTLSIQSQDYIVLKFSPTKMYENYEGTIIINSDDVFIPEIRIPFYANTNYHSGWNYVSFPREYLNSEDVINAINPFGISISSADGYMIYDETNREWDNYGLSDFLNTECYQVNMSFDANSYDIDLGGGNPYAVKTLYPNQYNWIGYWQDGSQNIDDAFGDDFDKLISIKSECWYYGQQVQNPDRETGIPVSPSNKMRALHFGRGYLVKVSEIIEGFNWNYTGNPYTKEAIETPSYFECEQTSDYTAIDVIGLDDDVYEIGAFVDSICVGAAVVVDSQAQILAYKEDIERSDVEVTFKLVSQRGTEPVEEYYVFNNSSYEFEIGTIMLYSDDYQFVSLTKNPNEPDDVPQQIILYNCYPNPFNPVTNISFSIPEVSDVNINIYNIKGQRVKIITDRIYNRGTHTVVWYGVNESGKTVSSGVYFYKLSVNGKSRFMKKCILLK